MVGFLDEGLLGSITKPAYQILCVSVVGFLDEGLLVMQAVANGIYGSVSVVGFLDEGLLGQRNEISSEGVQFQWLDF